jgi:hypothetical protein
MNAKIESTIIIFFIWFYWFGYKYKKIPQLEDWELSYKYYVLDLMFLLDSSISFSENGANVFANLTNSLMRSILRQVWQFPASVIKY